MKIIEKTLSGIAVVSIFAGFVTVIISSFNALRTIFFTSGYASLLALIVIFLFQTKSTLLKVILCFMAVNIIGTYFDYRVWPLSTLLLIFGLGRLVFPILLFANLKTQRFNIPHFYSGLIALLYVLPLGQVFLEFFTYLSLFDDCINREFIIKEVHG